MKRLSIALSTVAVLAALAASSAGAAPGVTSLSFQDSDSSENFVDANGNGYPDAGDYQTIDGTVQVVSSTLPGLGAAVSAQGTLSGKLVFVTEGQAAIRVVLTLPIGSVFIFGTAHLESESTFTLRAVGIMGGFARYQGVAVVAPTDGGAAIELQIGSRR